MCKLKQKTQTNKIKDNKQNLKQQTEINKKICKLKQTPVKLKQKNKNNRKTNIHSETKPVKLKPNNMQTETPDM